MKILSPSETGAGYDQIAEHWQDGSYDPHNGIAQHERALAFLGAGDWALDVGCGCNSRLHRLLVDRGLQFEGVDVSARMIDLARAANPRGRFYHADICEWQAERQYHFITAWDCLWHLPLTSQEPVLRKILHMLTPGGIFIFSAGGLTEPGEHSNSLMGPEIYYSSLGLKRMLDVIHEERCQLKHLEFDQYPEPHVYLIVQNSD